MDPYFKKQITYVFEDKTFKFDLGETLFSTFGIDLGTDFLLRNLKPDINPKDILDIGCGYGPIGIVLANKYPSSKVLMADRDLLAIQYTNYNIKLNEIVNAATVGSVGMGSISDHKFDLIVSNIPAKIGDKSITEDFILKPMASLNVNGELWVVVVNALNHLIPKIGSHNQLTFNLVKSRKGHSIYRFIKN